jgi:hypothetical protein
VQNSCSLFDENTYSGTALVPLPYSGRLVPASALYLEYAMLSKGNVLQYKKNSSNLTKQQRYAQIAKGKWVNRNTTWATQSTRGYTNPNNQSLQRVNSINITLDGQPTLAPVTCPKPFTPVNQPLPGTSSSGANPEVLPPPPPPPTVNTGTELPPTIIEAPILPIVIRDLGNLICGTEENVCTGEIIRQLVADNCHPTSDSDVPGPITELCWNDGNPTWYPRQRYVMTNSGNKWPDNYKLLVSAINPLPPVITSISNIENEVTLTWTYDEICLPVNDFTIYEDGIPVKIVSGTTFTTSFTVENYTTYTFYIVGSNGSIVSEPSNIVSIDIYSTPEITTPVYCYKTATISWTNVDEIYVDHYELYQNGSLIQNPAISPQSVTNLTNGVTYTFSVTAVYPGSIKKTSSDYFSLQPATSTYFSGSGYTSSDTSINATLTFTQPGSLTYNCPTEINNVQIFVIGGGGGGGGGLGGNGSAGSARGGGGGGGGEIIYLTSQTINNTPGLILITNIGSGGAGGAPSTNGADGTGSFFTFGISYLATFGNGGNGGNNFNAGGAGGGAGPNAGGDGGDQEISGDNSSYYNTNSFIYGGGGGGGNDNALGGGGGNGQGGNTPITTNTGQPGVVYGGGGGGGGSIFSGDQFAGGRGKQGAVIFIIPN